MKYIFVTTALMQQLTGKCLTQCQRDMRTMKAALKKERHQLVTIREYADYWGIPLEELHLLMDRKGRK